MKISSFHADRRGVTAIEYALIASLIAIPIFLSVSLLGKNIEGTFNTISIIFTGPAVPTPPAATSTSTTPAAPITTTTNPPT